MSEKELNSDDKLNEQQDVIEVPDTNEPSEIAFDDELNEEPSEHESVDMDNPEQETSKVKKLWRKYKQNKKVTIPLTVLAVLLLALIIPYTRYPILGLFIKKPVTVKVVDSQTGKSVSEAQVSVDGQSVQTNGDGNASFEKIKIGPRKFQVSKKFYSDTEFKSTVKLTGENKFETQLQATGRQVPITVTNKITGKPVKGATIQVGESKSETDEQGKATLVLDPDSSEEKATITSNEYNSAEVLVKVTDSEDENNKFSIVPAGKIYFLSKKTGKIDVVKTNLDGSQRETVLEGTGTEQDTDTVLLASRDWNYLALKSNRDGSAKLYLIDASNDKTTTIDNENATFTPYGWSDHKFVFLVYKNSNVWEPGQQQLKAYDADSKQLKTLDSSRAEGSSANNYAAEVFGQAYILENKIVYSKTWTAGYLSYGQLNGKRMGIYSVRADSTDKQTLRDFDVAADNSSYIIGKLYEPQEIYYQVYQQGNTVTYFKYESGEVRPAQDINQAKFDAFYPTYLVSPNGNKTFWSEPRDGKYSLFIGGKNAEDKKEIASLSDYKAFGWYGDEYILLSKTDSELYISPNNSTENPVLISSYHKASPDYAGYGYGYGGQ